MDEVAALVGDVLVEQAVFLDGFPVVSGTGFHPAQPPLELSQLFLGLPEPVGGVGGRAVVRRVEAGHGVFQAQRGFRRGDNGFRRLDGVLIKDAGVKFARFCFFHRDTLQLPAVPGAAGEFCPDDPGFGQAQAVFRDVDGGAGFKFMAAGGEGIPVGFFLFEFGAAEGFRIFEKHTECLRELVVLLDQRLIVHFFQKRRFFFVLGRGGNEVLVGFQVEPLLVRQHPVPDVPAAAEGVLEQLRLGFIGIKTRFDGGVLRDPSIPARRFRFARHRGTPPFRPGEKFVRFCIPFRPAFFWDSLVGSVGTTALRTRTKGGTIEPDIHLFGERMRDHGQFKNRPGAHQPGTGGGGRPYEPPARRDPFCQRRCIKMSAIFYMASDNPLREIPNPHLKTMSVNEALAAGLEDIPELLLAPGFDRDKPDVLLWSDIPDTEMQLDDDFAIWRLDPSTEDIYTEKKYRVRVEWDYTKGRAEKIIQYIREHLAQTPSLELWHVWVGNGVYPKIRNCTIPLDQFTADDLQELWNLEVWLEPTTHYCFTVTAR